MCFIIYCQPTVVYGGGCSEMIMENTVSAEAAKTPGKEAVTMEAVSRALQSLPITMADNVGLDLAQLISELRSAHALKKNNMGLDMENGCLGCIQGIGIIESFFVKRQVLVSAAEAAEIILRVYCIIKTAPRQRVEGRGHC